MHPPVPIDCLCARKIMQQPSHQFFICNQCPPLISKMVSVSDLLLQRVAHCSDNLSSDKGAAEPHVLLLGIVDAGEAVAVARVVGLVAVAKDLAFVVAHAVGLAVLALDAVAVATVARGANVTRVPVDRESVVAVGREDGGVFARAVEVGAVFKDAHANLPVPAHLLVLSGLEEATTVACLVFFVVSDDFRLVRERARERKRGEG